MQVEQRWIWSDERSILNRFQLDRVIDALFAKTLYSISVYIRRPQPFHPTDPRSHVICNVRLAHLINPWIASRTYKLSTLHATHRGQRTIYIVRAVPIRARGGLFSALSASVAGHATSRPATGSSVLQRQLAAPRHIYVNKSARYIRNE